MVLVFFHLIFCPAENEEEEEKGETKSFNAGILGQVFFYKPQARDSRAIQRGSTYSPPSGSEEQNEEHNETYLNHNEEHDEKYEKKYRNIKIRDMIRKEETMIMFSHLDNIARPLVPRAQPPRHVDQAEVCDDRSTVLQEDVLCLQVLMRKGVQKLDSLYSCCFVSPCE